MLFHGSSFDVHPEYAALFKAQGVAGVEDALRVWCPGEADPGKRTRVVELRIPRAGGSAHLFFKTYDYLGLWRLRTLFVPARVRREYQNLIGLATLGMKVPRAVACGQTRVLGFIRCSFLVTEAVENSIDLRELADGKAPPFPAPGRKDRRALITTFARQLRRCHDEGWFLYTAFFKNLLLSHGAGGYALYVIDVPFARIWRSRFWPARAMRRDLACLQQGALRLLSHTERLRFYRAYSSVERLGRDDRAFLRGVDRYQKTHYP